MKVEHQGGASRRWVWWVLLLLAAAATRLIAPDWDAGIGAHPDERFLVGVAQDVPLYANICAEVPNYPYGHLPAMLARLFVLVAPDADPLYVLRLVSGLVGVLLVAVTAVCGRALSGESGALLSAFATLGAPFLIQQAHFYTVDPIATIFACAAVLAARRSHWVISGVLTGLAVACKSSLALVAVILIAAAALARAPAPKRVPGREGRSRRGVLPALPFVASAVGAFVAVSPWSLLTPVLCWQGPLVQSLMASGKFEFPYTQQYSGTLAYVYPLVQIGLWGLGPVITGLGLLGVLCGGISALWNRSLRDPRNVAWLWPLAYFLAVGGLAVKFARYMLPLYPWWVAWGAYGALELPRKRKYKIGLSALIVVTTLVLGVAQLQVYRLPHPWITASEWLYSVLTSGDTVAVEAWDHPLPVPLPTQQDRRFAQERLPIFAEEDSVKRDALAAAVEQARVVVIASRRGYTPIARQAERYADTLAWYQTLFVTHEVHVFARCPRIGPLALTDDPSADAGLPSPLSLARRCGTRYALRLPRLDENFRVYDAPTTFVLVARD